MKIEKIVSKDLIICNNSEKVYEVCEKMKTYDIGFIPILKNNKFIGVITDRDIAVRIINNKSDLNSSIENYITKSFITIDKNESIDYAIDLMEKYQIKRLIVTNNNKIYGIVSLSDIVKNGINPYRLLNLLKTMSENNKTFDNSNVEIDTFYL